METAEQQDLRYPIGKFKAPETYTKEMLNTFLNEIEETPAKLRKAVEGLTAEQLDTPYRPGGWTVRQVVHHVPDSHMNAYIRIKMGLTEEQPLVKTYEEQFWAELKDTYLTPVSVSLDLLELLHKRWVILLRSLTDEQLEKGYRHPVEGFVNMKWVFAQYAWHGKHHIAHITSLRERKGW